MSKLRSRLLPLFEEARRRRLFRVVILYVLVGLAALEVEREAAAGVDAQALLRGGVRGGAAHGRRSLVPAFEERAHHPLDVLRPAQGARRLEQNREIEALGVVRLAREPGVAPQVQRARGVRREPGRPGEGHVEARPPADLGEPYHRWLTAIGDWSGNLATLDVVNSFGGVFDDQTEVTNSDPGTYGTMTIEFHDCRSATLTYDLVGIGSGEIPIRRIVREAEQDGEYRIASLILGVIESDAFRMKGTAGAAVEWCCAGSFRRFGRHYCRFRTIPNESSTSSRSGMKQ